MTEHVLSYAEAEFLESDVFFYDFEMTEQDPEKSTKSYVCPYCNARTNWSAHGSSHNLFVCASCGWWQVVSGGGGFGFKECKIHRGQLKRYSVDAFDVPLKDLRTYLYRHPDHVAFVNPTVFERLIGDCLKDSFGPCEVIHVGGTADRGIDLILIRIKEGTRLVQVKRRSDLTKPEGVQVVRDLNGVLFRENVAKGMVVTTAPRFTKAAMKETKVGTPTREIYDMKLMPYSEIVELFDVKPGSPHNPWVKFLQ